MKARMLIIGASIVLLSVFLLADWNPGEYVPKENEEVYGTWVNKDNHGYYFSPQKQIITANGYKKFYKISDPAPFEEGTRLIYSKWTDAESNIWYKAYGTVTTGTYKGYNYQVIGKLSKGATVYEFCFTGLGTTTQFDTIYFPTKVSPSGSNYVILHRQKE